MPALMPSIVGLPRTKKNTARGASQRKTSREDNCHSGPYRSGCGNNRKNTAEAHHQQNQPGIPVLLVHTTRGTQPRYIVASKNQPMHTTAVVDDERKKHRSMESFCFIPAMMPSILGPKPTEGNTRDKYTIVDQQRHVLLLLLLFLLFFRPEEEEAEEVPGAAESIASHRSSSSRILLSWRGVRPGVFSKATNSAQTNLRRTFHFLRASFASSSLFTCSSFVAASDCVRRKARVAESTPSPAAPARDGVTSCGRLSSEECRTVRSLLCGPGSGGRPGRSPG